MKHCILSKLPKSIFLSWKIILICIIYLFICKKKSDLRPRQQAESVRGNTLLQKNLCYKKQDIA